MSKLRRGAAVLVAASLSVPVWGVPTASADEQVLLPSAAGYFNADGVRKPDESPAAPPSQLNTGADGVGVDHLAVAARAGSENKVSFLLFDLFDLGVDVTVSKAVLTVPVAPDGDGNVNIAPAPEKVIACPAGEGGFLGDDGTAIQDAPERMCEVAAVKAAATADGAAYAFDITAVAQAWLTDVNNGLALTSDPAARSTAFQRVFKPAAEAKLALTFTSADGGSGELVLPTVPDAPSTETGSGSSDLGGSFDGGSFDSGAGADTSFDTASEPVLSADVPVTPEDTAVAAEEPALATTEETATTVPVASTMSSSLTPTLSFWVGLLLLAAVLGLLSLIMGDPRVPQAASRQTRLSQALQARQRGGSATSRPALGL